MINKIMMDLNFTEEEKQKSLAVIPFSIDGHSTTLMIKLKPENERKMYIEDFSTYHLSMKPGFNLTERASSSPNLRNNNVNYKEQLYKQKSLDRLPITIMETRPNLLGKASEYCEVLNTSSIQLNGTCNFWMLAFCQVAEEYISPDLLLQDCKNGIIDIKTANKMCEFFGMNELFSEIKKTDIEDEHGKIIDKKTKCNEILIKAGPKYFSINIDVDHLQSSKNLFLDFNCFFEKFEIVQPQNSLDMKKSLIESLKTEQQKRAEITYALAKIQEDIEKYVRKLIRYDPIVLDLKKLYNEYESTLFSISELYINKQVPIVPTLINQKNNSIQNKIIYINALLADIEKKEKEYESKKKILNSNYRNLFRECSENLNKDSLSLERIRLKAKELFNSKKQELLCSLSIGKRDIDKMKNIPKSREKLLGLFKSTKEKIDGLATNYKKKLIPTITIPVLGGKKPTKLTPGIYKYTQSIKPISNDNEKKLFNEYCSTNIELLEEQLKSRNERDDLKIKMLFKKMEAVVLSDITQENISAKKEEFDIYLKSAELANEELEALNLELDTKDANIKLCIKPDNEYIKAYLDDINDKKNKISENIKKLKQQDFSEQNFKLINDNPKKILLECQQKSWELENKFNEERFIDNRKDHEKSEVTTLSKKNPQRPSNQPNFSFVEREKQRKQQKQKSSSTPVRFGY